MWSIISADSKTVDENIRINTYTYDQMCEVGLIVEVGTNGFKGGDWGHGGRTFFSMRWPDGCAFITDNVEILKNSYNEPCGISFTAGGDWELSQLIDGIKFAVKVLEEQSKETEK